MDRLSESGAIAGSKELWTCRAEVAPPRPDGRASLCPDPASPAAPDPRGCSSPFPRRASLRRRLRPRDNAATLLRGARACLALLGAAALLALTAPAQAQQTTVWSATLTPVDIGASILGCDTAATSTPPKNAATSAVLSDNDFTYDSTDYTVISLFVQPNGTLTLVLSTPPLTTATAALTLVVGSTHSRPRQRRRRPDFGKFRWSSTSVSLTVGTAVTVSLVSGTVSANAAPTVANPIDDQTATVGTALNFAFPTNTFADTDAGDTLTYTADQIRRFRAALVAELRRGHAHVLGHADGRGRGDSLGEGDGERRHRLGQRHLRHRGLGGGQHAPVFADATASRSFTETVGDAAVSTAGRRGRRGDGDGRGWRRHAHLQPGRHGRGEVRHRHGQMLGVRNTTGRPRRAIR